MPDSLSPAQARRVALAAQGFGAPPPAAVGTRQLTGFMERIGALQIDSVNVFERSHYLPAFARLGGYDKALLDRLTFAKRARYLETWAHVAAFVPRDDWPLWAFRRADQHAAYHRDGEWPTRNGEMLDWLRAELAAKGPLKAGEIEHDANVRRGPWWGWSDVKLGLEYLWSWGEVVTSHRVNFERVYALAEQVIPGELLGRSVPRDDAIREVLRRAARHHGVGTVADLADYYRIKPTIAAPYVRDLVDEGTLLPVTIAGWKQQAYLHRDARIPRRIEAAALLSPFDPVVWFRDRSERLFDFRYRIEIYTPAPQRQFGYYTLPVLVDDRVAGRIDLKSDRKAGVLRVQSAWREPHAPADFAARVVPALRAAAAWQGLEDVAVQDWGDAAPAVAAELGVALLPRD